MATIIINHRVKDFDTWKKIYDEDADRRKGVGLHPIKVSGTADDPNLVYIIFETDDLSAFDKIMNQPETEDKLKRGGVISIPEVVLLRD